MHMRADVVKAFELLRSPQRSRAERGLALLQKTVFAFSMSVCGHREDAEDTAQDVLLKASAAREKFDSPQALISWLYTVARNRCWMSRRRSKFAPHPHLSLEELMPDAAELAQWRGAAERTPESQAATAQELDRLRQAILRIPPAYRIVLVLRDIEELSDEEVARVLNLKPGTVRVRLHRARLFVRKEVAARNAAKPAVSGAKNRRRNAGSVPRACTPQCKRIFANLSNFMDGVLDGELCAELERHVHGCPDCEAFMADLHRTVAQTHRLGAAAAQQG